MRLQSLYISELIFLAVSSATSDNVSLWTTPHSLHTGSQSVFSQLQALAQAVLSLWKTLSFLFFLPRKKPFTQLKYNWLWEDSLTSLGRFNHCHGNFHLFVLLGITFCHVIIDLPLPATWEVTVLFFCLSSVPSTEVTNGRLSLYLIHPSIHSTSNF